MQKLSMSAALAAAALLVSLPAVAEIREVEVTGGRLAGVSANGIVSFKGIPFAAPPVGPLRWKAPQPVKTWTGVKQAFTFGASCMQDPNFAKIFGTSAPLSEDCLYLNVWTPAKTASDSLPVMVWIYGGGFAGGMTSIPAYDGTHFAEKGVVLVSVAYRVGAFGFLAHPELSRESDGSGNYGLEDMIAGLRWVKANVGKFGGDPSRVTIFGESAGGIAVSMLAASPKAKGLFQGAISESGGNFGWARFADEGGVNVTPLKAAETAGRNFWPSSERTTSKQLEHWTRTRCELLSVRDSRAGSGPFSTATCCQAISMSCTRLDASTIRPCSSAPIPTKVRCLPSPA